MKDYYIKYITGPCGQEGYPESNGNLVAFRFRPDRFKNCAGFLLYETGHKNKKMVGAKAIYACGSIDADQVSFLGLPEFGVGEKWPYVVKVVIQKRVDPLNGVPRYKVEEIIGREVRRQKNGILKITEREFKLLSEELDRCLI